MEKVTNSSKSLFKTVKITLVIMVCLFAPKILEAQAPCFEVHNQLQCPITISWETVDANNAHIAGANPVNLSPGGPFYISLSNPNACSGAANCYIYVHLIDGVSSGQLVPVDFLNHTSESGTTNGNCQSWTIDTGASLNPGVFHIH